jgi:mannosyl-3-phosphoglycerate phosphatase
MNTSVTHPLIAVFTDLDGSLLDHADYSFDAARPALARMREQGIPLVFATSKTRAEVEALHEQMGLHEPFIVENGAALFFPDDYRELRIDAGFRQPPYTVVQLGASYGKIRRFVYATRGQVVIRGFGDMSVAEVADVTGLPVAQAALARRREFTEPFLPQPGTDMDAFGKLAAAHGLQITRGGRFHHLIGIRQDKGAAVRIAAGIFSKNAGAPVTTIGLGDSANDLPMLACVDIPVVIPRPDGSLLNIDRPGVRTAPAPGSAGWAAALLPILKEFQR